MNAPLTEALIKGLDITPDSIALVLLCDKRPIEKNWNTKAPLTKDEVIRSIESGKATGYGIRTGEISGGLLAIDADGHAAHEKIVELSGGQPLPETVAFTSGKPGRCQYLFHVPPEHWGEIRTRKIRTGVNDPNGKEQLLELRWNDAQSVLPPSRHPETGSYKYKEGCSFNDVSIAVAPQWVIEAMKEGVREEVTPQQSKVTVPPLPVALPAVIRDWKKEGKKFWDWSDKDKVIYLISLLSPSRANNYQDWLKVGTVIKGINSVHGLRIWEDWSRQSPKFKEGECCYKYKSLTANLGLGVLVAMVKEDIPDFTLPFSSSKDEWLKEREEELFEFYKQSKSFTPDKIVNQKFIDISEFTKDKNQSVAINSPMNSGKTTFVCRELGKRDSVFDRGARLIGHRNNLLIQTLRKLTTQGRDAGHLRYDDLFSLLSDAKAHIGYCLDSIEHTHRGHYTGVDVVLDEVISLITHALSGETLGSNQGAALALLVEALQECLRIICLDGNLNNGAVSLLEKLSGKKIWKIKNVYKQDPHTITFIQGINTEGEVKKGKDSPLIQALCEPEVIPFIVCDSKTLAIVLDKILKDSGKKGVCFHGDNSSEDDAKSFFTDPDKYIEEKDPDYVILSPSGESGIDIHNTRPVGRKFTHKFSFFVGVLTTDSQSQIMFRLRDILPHYVICPDTGIQTDSNPRTYNIKDFQQTLEDRILSAGKLAALEFDSTKKHTLDFGNIARKALEESQEKLGALWDYAAVQGVIENYERANLLKCLVWRLKESGHIVEFEEWNLSPKFEQKKEEKKAEYIKEESEAIFNAKDIPYDEAKERKFDATREEMLEIKKAKFKYRLQGIEGYEDIWKPEFLATYLLEDRDFISKVERYWLVNNPVISSMDNFNEWAYEIKKEHLFKKRFADAKHLKIWGLNRLNIAQFFEDEKEWSANSPELAELVKQGGKENLVTALGFSPPKPKTKNNKPIKGSEGIPYLRRLLELCGISLVEARRENDKERTRIYKLNIEERYARERLIILDCIQRKFFSKFNDSQAKSIQQKEKLSQELMVSVNPLPEKILVSVPDLQKLQRNGTNGESSIPTEVTTLQTAIAYAVKQGLSESEALEIVKDINKKQSKAEKIEEFVTTVNNKKSFALLKECKTPEDLIKSRLLETKKADYLSDLVFSYTESREKTRERLSKIIDEASLLLTPRLVC
jgi:Bifunctional DNA primase/polymerase, N-terminal/Primase C terminal 2 (PriCT-2)